MDIDELLKYKNRKTRRIIGAMLVGIPTLFKLSGGKVSEGGATGWFGAWFVVILSIMFLVGVILLGLGESQEKK